MLENRQPRHKLRAQGRAQVSERDKSQSLKSDATGLASGAALVPSDNSSSAGKYSRLLDYLSQSAAGTDRTILDHASPHAVVSSSSAAQLLEAWFNKNSKADSESGDTDNEGSSEGYWPGGGSYDSFADERCNVGRYPASYTGGYFGTEKISSSAASGAAGSSRRVQREIDAGAAGGPGAYLRSLRKVAEQSQANLGAGDGVQSENKNISRCGSPVEVTEEASGSRVETFPSGAKVFKDGLGHVREIVSAGGVTVVFKYDDHGHLSAFVRTDVRGTIHSLAEADRHGVILRDAGGRVKAQGESMQVDACGCVSIARQDGQFWSLDLVRNVNIERRLLPDEHGNWYSMTALFSSDGFRMATRFRQVKPDDFAGGQNVVNVSSATSSDTSTAVVDDTIRGADYWQRYSSQYSSQRPRKPVIDGTIASLAPGRIDFLSQEDSGNYRFYGRDGSIIEFDSDDELKQLKPSRVLAASTRTVASGHRGKRQAGTAWEALREYVFNYLAAL